MNPKPPTIHHVDAFTDRPFAGNPAAVCILESDADAQWMQSVAAEMNLSETAFLRPDGDIWQLRWFTPAVEVDLCGHATLASAHVLWETGVLPATAAARFQTRSGLLTATRAGDSIELDFPTVAVHETTAPEGLELALGEQPVHIVRTHQDLIVELASEAEVRRCTPDFGRIRALPTRAIGITSRASSPEFDIVSRFFAPTAGVDEDPATGSLHCALAPYWATRLHRTQFRAYQASRRGGFLHVTLDGARVRLRGQAVTVLRGIFA